MSKLLKKCQNYSATISSTVNCIACNAKVRRAGSKYFVYISLEAQLKKSISENLEDIVSYSHVVNSSGNIIDVQSCALFKAAQKKFPNSIVLSMTINTDGTQIFNNCKESIWPIQIIQNYLHPSKRFKTDNIIVVALHRGKPNMRDFFTRF